VVRVEIIDNGIFSLKKDEWFCPDWKWTSPFEIFSL
jgi:hypothetical protein